MKLGELGNKMLTLEDGRRFVEEVLEALTKMLGPGVEAAAVEYHKEVLHPLHPSHQLPDWAITEVMHRPLSEHSTHDHALIESPVPLFPELEEVLLVRSDPRSKQDQGIVDISTRIDLRGDTTYVILLVGDHGYGMSPDVQEHVLEPFYTTKKHGTGLGLATVNDIVKSMSGFIDIHSKEHEGTKISVFIPVVQAPVSLPEHARRRTTPLPFSIGEHILLVEDNAIVRATVRRVLDRGGYQVTTALHGRQALKILSTNADFTLLLTDVLMPEMGGKELVEQVRVLYPELPVLFMTGYAEPNIEDHLGSNVI